MSLLKTNEIQNYNGSSLTLTASTVSTSAQLNTGGNISVTGSLNVSDDSTTRTNLGLGTIATQDSDNVNLTGGTVGSGVNIKASINASGSAPIYACRAWVHFNGTGTPSIAASGNISSITDLGTGLFTCNFTTALEDQHYVIACGSAEGGSGPSVSDRMTLVARGDASFSSSGASVHCRDITATTDRDQQNICVAVFR